MGNFDGQVLPGARASTSNADTTGEVSSGVSRAVFTSTTPDYPTATVTDINGARYRATLLESGETVEYLLWANSSGPLTVAPGTTSTDGTVAIPTGDLPVGAYLDGTHRVVLTDNGGANISSVTALTFTQGGTTTPVPVPGGTYTFDATSGTITLATLVVSASRGDTFAVTYEVAPATFNWTRNDPTGTRFGWNAAHRKWEPYKGGAVKNLGKLLASAGTRYTLSPVPTVAVGKYLPGTTGANYAMLRLGAQPDETSYPVVDDGTYDGVLVVADDQATPSYAFGNESGVMGQNSGTIVWNPAFVAAHEGETLWYSPRDFAAKNDGVVGPLVDGTWFISPVPGPTDRPILRIGQRAPLTVVTVATETDLAALTVPSGSAGVALSTGRVKLNATDVARANPASGTFDPLYLEASLRYDGLALNRYPQPVQAPVQLTTSGADYTLPAAVGLPGTGVSGIVRVPDGTGNTPDPSVPVQPRPLASGLVKRLNPGFGDAYLFTDAGRVAKIIAVNYDTDLPTDIFAMPLDTAYVSLETGLVRVGYALRQLLDGKDVYFVQALLTPASYPDTARIFSRIRDTFTFAGGETFTFRVDGVNKTFTTTAGTFTAAQVATQIATATGVVAGVLNGYLYIASATLTGSLSVGFSEDGCRVTGFPPGWYVSNPSAGDKSSTDLNWLPDTGTSFGLSRSPNNLDGSQSAPDVRATYRVTDTVLSEDLQAIPYQLLNYPPREDIAGYDDGEFFALSGVASPNTLRIKTTVKPWQDAVYQFDQSRFGWLSSFSFAGQVQSPVSSINLGNPGVVPATFYPAMGGSLKVSSKGGAAQSLTLGTDFLVPEGSGTAVLIARIGDLKQSGYRGAITLPNTLTDTSLTITASAGDRLKVTSGANEGSYTVTASTATTITVTPDFLAASTGNVAWELYNGVAPGDINPAVLGDAVYTEFNHLNGEPYEVRLLTGIGTAPAAPSAIDLPTANSGRTLAVRFGLTGANLPATILTSTELGAIANGSLYVPTVVPRFTTGSFSVVVGTKVFAHGVDLLPVANFLAPIPANVVQYRTTDGELRFGATVLSDYQSATAVYREEVLPSANVLAGTSEISPFTGAVSVAGLLSHTDRIYLVDLQTYDSVFLNPILGSFSFQRPVQTGQLVEVTYLRAVPDSGALYLDGDGNPVQVTEFLPVFIRREEATRVTSQVYTFNAAGRTIDADVEPSVYVGSTLVSYGFPKGVTVDTVNDTISLVKAVNDPATKVRVTYGVFEAVGGETSYTVSQGPVWRPPFRLEANVSTFKLDGDRTSDMVPGRILRIGNYLTYIKAASYVGPPADITTVTVYPTPTKSVGTLSPSEPPINLLTDRAITPTVNPAGTSPVVTTADAGFLPLLTTAYGLASVPAFQPVTKGQNVVRFEGDLTRYAVAGHVIELFGIPFLVAKSDFVDGAFTDITLGSPSPVQMVWSSGMNPNLARISVRPIYSEGALVFIGSGAFVGTEPYEVVLYEGTAPGRTLAEGQDYQLDPSAGTLTLMEPRTRGLPALSSLQFYRTAQNTLAPFVFQGKVQYPRVSANAGFIDPPSDSNGRLGATLTATYTFDSPDSFYARSLPLPAYITETARSIVQGVTRNAAGTSPSVGGFPKNSPSTQGTAGLVSERQDLVSRDRVTRTFLRYFNGVITSFEQVLETINGNPVGDRDGKLRLWMGAGDPWTPPGYEDGITGAVNSRNVWNEVWNGYRTSPIALLPSDPIVSPYGATLTGGVLTGTTLSASALGQLQGLQYRAIKNDVDDVVLNGLTGTTLSLSGIIRFRVTSYGVYRGLSQPSAFSRLYPERAEAFTTTDPGIGYDPATGATGVYSYGKLDLDLFGSPPSVSFQSTTGNSIARLSNPVRGNITSVLGATVQDRLARARIIAYYPNGVSGVTTSPVFLATVLPLDKFPLLPNGQPDTAKLVAGAGISGLYDLTSGDPDLHTPPFAPGDQLALGTPDGTTYSVGWTGATVTVNGNPVFPGVFVDSVLQGCYLTVKSYSAANTFVSVTNPATLVRLTSGNTGTTLTAERGDTLFVVPSTGAFTAIASPPASALTPTQLQTFTASLPGYRVGTDVDLDGRAGALVDATLPSFSDPTIFGLKEITGQRPPSPLRNLQARVTFQNGDVSPSNIPALRGLSRLDSGDYSLPYYQISPTELSVLGETFPLGIAVIGAESPNPPVGNPAPPGFANYTVEAVYPDEILDNGGLVSATDPVNPATLKGTVVLNPGYVSHTGTGDVKPYDLVYIQEGTGGGSFPPGATGIRTVGAVNYTANVIEPPRFVTRTSQGALSSLLVENIQAWTDPSYTTGVVVTEDTNVIAPLVRTTFTLSGIAASVMVFDDGAGGGVLPVPVGGFNDYFTIGVKPNKIRLKFAKPSTGNLVLSSSVVLDITAPNPNITLCVFNVSGDNGVLNQAGTAYFLTQQIVVDTALPFFQFLSLGVPTTPAPGVTEIGPLNVGIDADSGSVGSGGTKTMYIGDDRLTLYGPIDTRTARPRGTTTPGGDSIACALTTRGFEAGIFDSTLGLVSAFSTLNKIAEVNGGTAFTFAPRAGITPYGVGTFTAPGVGTLKVMAYEGHGNTLINGTDVTYSAAPSSRQDENGPILLTDAISDRVDNPPYTSLVNFAPRIVDRFVVDPTAVTRGAMSRVLPGDIVTAKNSILTYPLPRANTKAGTHLVRAVMVATVGFTYETRETFSTPDTNGDYGDGWMPFTFPTVTGFNLGTLTLAVSDIAQLPAISGWLDAPVTQTHVFPATGRVYVIANESGLNSTNVAVFQESVVSATYASFDPSTKKFTGLANFQDALGVPLTAAQFNTIAAAGMKVSGFTILPMDPHSDAIPANLPGYTSVAAPVAVFGVRQLRVSRDVSGVTHTWNAAAAGNLTGPGSTVSVYQRVKASSASFVTSLDTAVYDEVPGGIEIDLDPAQWETLHTPVGAPFVPTGTQCLLPGDRWEIDYSGGAGIYVEPSFPRDTNDMASGDVNVVDAGNSLAAGQVGTRRLSDYFSAPAPGDYQIEATEIEVRRPRRFHALGNDFGARLQALRYCYEIRRGIVATVTTSGGYSTLTSAPVDGAVPPVATAGGTATQLGDFTRKLVNVNPGDEVRFIGASGDVYARAEVVKVTGALTLTLSRKVTVTPGDRFEVYLKVPPVPHEQSNEELLGYATDRVLLNRPANLVAQTGGRAPATNTLADTGGTVNYTALGIEEGDLVLIDPAGTLTTPAGSTTPPQRGRRPYGDNAVQGRANYVAGGPVRADDNRGYYRVASPPTATQITVAALGGLAGNDGADVTFGTGTNAYTVYPTIHASGLTGGKEGQMDLRETSLPVGNSYATTFRSVEPFAYRVIRPTSLLTTETVELILAMRERMLSWMEEIRAVQFKYGTYFVFQRDRHITDLGTTSDPESGLGLLTNPYIFGIIGNWTVSPFSNVRDCLSILDRRFWCLDFRLDTLTPPYGISATDYADLANGVGRPVLVDRVNEALDARDKLRATRYAWLDLRVNRVTGSLENIRRFDVERPRREAEAERALLTVQSVEKLP